MDEHNETITIGCALVGALADLTAIIAAMQSFINWGVALFVIAVMSAASALFALRILRLYKDRVAFLDFINFLLYENKDNHFLLLPKICIVVDKSGGNGKLRVREMNVKYTVVLDDSGDKTSPEDVFSIDYHLECESNTLPEEFAFFSGNQDALSPMTVTQKHGSQTKYQSVPSPLPLGDTKDKYSVYRCCWQLKDEYVTKTKITPLSFQVSRVEKRSSPINTIILYPRNFAPYIEKLNVEFCYISNPDVLVSVEPFRIWKENQAFKCTPIPCANVHENQASLILYPNSTKYEAYYFKLHLSY